MPQIQGHARLEFSGWEHSSRVHVSRTTRPVPSASTATLLRWQSSHVHRILLSATSAQVCTNFVRKFVRIPCASVRGDVSLKVCMCRSFSEWIKNKEDRFWKIRTTLGWGSSPCVLLRCLGLFLILGGNPWLQWPFFGTTQYCGQKTWRPR